jgi:sirohydrochlorin ferrochelatase
MFLLLLLHQLLPCMITTQLHQEGFRRAALLLSAAVAAWHTSQTLQNCLLQKRLQLQVHCVHDKLWPRMEHQELWHLRQPPLLSATVRRALDGGGGAARIASKINNGPQQ